MHMYDLIMACQIQVKLQHSPSNVYCIDNAIIDDIKAQANIVHTGQTGGQKAWPAMMRRVKRTYPEFDQ
jgi:hypothetical protein